MKDTKVNLVVGNMQFFNDGESLSDDNRRTFNCDSVINEKYAMAKWYSINKTNFFYVGLPNKLFDISFLRGNYLKCIPAHGVVDDIYFAFQCHLKVTSIATVSNVTYCYRNRDGSAIHSNVSLSRMNLYLHIFDLIYDDLKNEELKSDEMKIPAQLYHIITCRYLYGFITKNIMYSSLLSRKDKSKYLFKVSRIRKLNITSKDIIGRKNRLIYYLLQFKSRFWLISLLFRLMKKK